jgi:hypothetical protein
VGIAPRITSTPIGVSSATTWSASSIADGALLGVPYPGGCRSFDKTARGFTHAPRMERIRGFVFAGFAGSGISLAERLVAATRLNDRSCDLSPEGRGELTAGWVRHRWAANGDRTPLEPGSRRRACAD